MLTPRHLTEADLAALDDLERRVTAGDGSRLKLEKPVLEAGDAKGLLTYDGARLVGFLGVYDFGGPVELAGAVDPAFRRRGVGSVLLDAALRAQPGSSVLLVLPAGSAGGEALARARGGTRDHAEYSLALTVPPGGPEDPRTTVRAVRPEDAHAVTRLLQAAFGPRARPLGPDTLVIERDHVLVGSLRLTRTDDAAGVYGFVVDPQRRGEDIGRSVLRTVCRQALAEGAVRVELDVDVDNPAALGLYTSTGFRVVAGDDYWSLPAGENR